MSASAWWEPNGIVINLLSHSVYVSDYCPCYPTLCHSQYQWTDHSPSVPVVITPVPIGVPTVIPGVLTYDDGTTQYFSDFHFEFNMDCDTLWVDWYFTPLDPPRTSVVIAFQGGFSGMECGSQNEYLFPHDPFERRFSVDIGCTCLQPRFEFRHMAGDEVGGIWATIEPGFVVKFEFDFLDCGARAPWLP